MAQRLGLLFVVAVSIVVSGCFGDISGTVTVDGVGVAGLSVVLTGDVDMTGLTDDTGSFVFQNVQGGTYQVTMSPPAGYTRSVSQEGGQGVFRQRDGCRFLYRNGYREADDERDGRRDQHAERCPCVAGDTLCSAARRRPALEGP